MESLNRPPLKLLFGTPEFLPEDVVQSTIRVGQKWRDDLKGKVAPRIPCFDLEGNEVGTATVVGSLFGSFKDFGYIGSTVNHDEKCRDFDGLVEVLTECYPDFKDESSQITVIFFKFASCIPDAAEEEEPEEVEDTSAADEKAEADRIAADEAAAAEEEADEAAAEAENSESDDSSDDTVTESGNDIAKRVSDNDSSDESPGELVTEESSGEEVDKTESEMEETS